MTNAAPLSIPSASLSRLALYLRATQALEAQGVEATSSQQLADLVGVQPFHVRKDLAYCGRFGRQGQGYAVGLLRRELTRSLGLNRRWHYVIVGLGHLGKALLTTDWGEQFVCVGLFDAATKYQGVQLSARPLPQPQVLGQLPPAPRQLRVRPLSQLGAFVQEQLVDMALLCADPADQTISLQQVQQAGIRGVLNFGAAQPNLSTAQDAVYWGEQVKELSDEENDTIIEQVDFQVSLQRLTFGLLSHADRSRPSEEPL